MTALTFGAAIVLIVTLAASGIAKLRSPSGFAAQLARYEILPPQITGVVARVIPALELSAAVLLALGLAASPPARQLGALLAGLLLFVFLFALTTAHVSGRAIPCACFGGGGDLEVIGAHSIVRTGLLLGLDRPPFRGHASG